MRPNPTAEVIQWLNNQSEVALYLSTVTIAELRAGVEIKDEGKRKDDLNQRTEATLDLFAGRFLNFDVTSATLFGGLFAHTRRKGFSISFPDCMITAIAQANRCTIATRDVRPFEAAGLEVINPWTTYLSDSP